MEALFIKLVNLSITASWLVLAVLILRLIFRKAPKWIFCMLWGLVALRLVLPFSIESALSLIPSAEPLPQEILYATTPQIQSGVYAIDRVVNPILSTYSPMTGDSVNPTQIWSTILFCVWVAGMVAMLLYALGSCILLKNRVSTATRLRGNIKQSEHVDTPFVLGFFRPTIYLPYQMSEIDLNYVIAHEQAHIRRKDHWWKPIGFVLLSIYWFNPLLWVAYILLCRDIETACDEKAIQDMKKDERRAYSTALLNCSIHRRRIAACPLAFGEVGVKERVKSVMAYKKPALLIIILAVIASIVVAVCLLTNPDDNKLDAIEPSSHNYRVSVISEGVKSFVEPSYYPDGFDWKYERVQSAKMLGTGKLEFNVDWDTDELVVGEDYYRHTDNSTVIEKETYRIKRNKNGTFELSVASRGSSEDEAVYFIQRNSGVYVMKIMFSDKQSVNNGTQPVATGETITKATYVSSQCLYMNPLSSGGGFGGDSGCQYIVGKDSFAIVDRSNGVSLSTTGEVRLDMGNKEYTNNRIDVPKWGWQKFPYTDEEWAKLYKPGGSTSVKNISERYNEILYQPLSEGKFLLRVDGSLWLVELNSNDRMGTYLWSIFSLVPESTMGMVQWTYTPLVSSRYPVFRFEFDMDYTEVSAVCTESPLVDFKATGKSDFSMVIRKGDAMWWSPVGKDGKDTSKADIHFTVHNGDSLICSGTIYITAGVNSQGTTIYTASLVGTGLHLDQNKKMEGGVISAM